MNLITAIKRAQLKHVTKFDCWRYAFAFYSIYYLSMALPYAKMYYGDWSALFFVLQILLALGFVFATGRMLAVCAFGLLMINIADLALHTEVISPEVPLLNTLFIVLFFWKISGTQSLRHQDLPEDLLFLLCCGVAATHFSAGVTKFLYNDEGWKDGTALRNILATSPWARSIFSGFILQYVPSLFLKWISYFSVLVELSGPLVLFRRTRLVWCYAALGMHVGALFMLNLSQVSWGVILYISFLLIFVHNREVRHES